MQDIVIVSAVRTAVGKFGGSLAKIPATELGAIVIKEALARAGIDPSQVGEVIMGQVLAAGAGQNPARQASLKAGVPKEVPALTINAVCGSGLKAVMLAAQAVAWGDSEIVVAGGQENMSAAPHVLPNSRDGQRMGDWKLQDTMIVDGLWDVYNQYHMGVTAENVAKEHDISREKQDALALGSQQKASAAQEAGRFKDEIVAVTIPQRKGDPLVFDSDEFINKKTSAEALAGLRPAFDKAGSVTAGNASGLNDGAAGVAVGLGLGLVLAILLDLFDKPLYADWFNQIETHHDAEVAKAYEVLYGKPLDISTQTATAAWVKAFAENAPLLSDSSTVAEAAGAHAVGQGVSGRQPPGGAGEQQKAQQADQRDAVAQPGAFMLEQQVSAHGQHEQIEVGRTRHLGARDVQHGGHAQEVEVEQGDQDQCGGAQTMTSDQLQHQHGQDQQEDIKCDDLPASDQAEVTAPEAGNATEQPSTGQQNAPDTAHLDRAQIIVQKVGGVARGEQPHLPPIMGQA